MHQTCLQNSLTRGSHVMVLCRLTYILLWFRPHSHYSMHFSVHFLSQIMSLKYLWGLHLSICDFYIKWIYQYHTYIWVRENQDIVASDIISAYDVNKKQNSILKLPWLHTPDSHFSRNGYDTARENFEQKIEMIDSFCIFGFSVSSFVSWNIYQT